jgi:alkylation response protein AidB-like acyl-CoA dehydrogenase
VGPSSPTADDALRTEVRGWLEEQLSGEFAALRGTGGPGREHEHLEGRAAWERRLGEAGWIGLGGPRPWGRGASLREQVVFAEEYARTGAPGRLGHMGEQLLVPTLLAFGTPEQQARFVPGVASGEVLWCQGYSEPGAGSDLAAVSTRARVVDGRWVVSGQKVWTSLAHLAGWCFVLARTEPGSTRHAGLSLLLVEMDQPGVTVRPIVQLTGTAEFNEVFLDDAVTDVANVVGAPGQGWSVAMGLLGYERGVSTLGQQIGFARELDAIVARARDSGAAEDPVLADALVQAWVDLQVLHHTALRTLGDPTRMPWAASVSKLLWSTWHRRLGELALAVDGPDGVRAAGAPYDLTDAQRLFLFSRADTLYGGSLEVQRNVLSERTLGLPRDVARPPAAVATATTSG